MQQNTCSAENSRGLPLLTALYTLGVCAIAAVGVAVQQGNIYAAAVLGMLASEIIQYGCAGRHVRVLEALQDGLTAAALAASAAPDITIWQAPATWSELFAINAPAAALACMLYFVLCAYTAWSAGRHIRIRNGFSLLLVPYLFNWLLLLQSPGLIASIGRALTFGCTVPPELLQWIGGSVVLMAVNEAAATILFLALAGRLLTERRMHRLLLFSALFAAGTPLIADLGSGPAVDGLPPVLGACAAVAAALLSQAGLWAQTFLITGILMDSLHGKHPVSYWGWSHFTEGFVKGIIYTMVFMGLVHGTAGILAVPGLWALVRQYPIIIAAITGMVFFPMVKTVVESFDGSLPFFTRLRNNYSRSDHWLRGSAVGAGLAWAIRDNLPAEDPATRFLCGFCIGAVAYGAMNILRDSINVVLLERRLRLQSIKIYLTEALMGGLAGGALAWYFDGLQTGVVAAKFKNYITLFYGSSGMKIEDYVIYPLFSKWGAMNLGTVTGGVRLFYSESLSGVINWSIAAPLFSINLVLLTALVKGSSEPLKNLFTRQGLVGMVEQAFRVQRWGLWMAPIIYSFLRMSPSPTWYNQDGAIRTAVATVKSLTSTPEAFNAWSLATFTNMLAYDWLRIALYIDHMGLRVATLVNFSFIGVDALDEKIARFYGHSLRTRVIPQGLRRFVTWAPLLIPFYIPRGSQWQQAWGGAEQIAKAHPLVLFPPVAIAGGFMLLACGAGAVMLVQSLRQRSQTLPARVSSAASEPCIDDGVVEIGNGFYTFSLTADGKGWSRVYSAVRKGSEFDLTRRPHDPLQVRGKFFYFTDLTAPENVWSLTYQPVRKAGPDYRVTRLDHASLRIVNTWSGIHAEAVVRIDGNDPVEIWTLRLRNLTPDMRMIKLTSYREFALNVSDAYMRHPDFNNLHIGTWFVPALNAVIARNRLLKDTARDPLKRKASGEVVFHAVGENPDSSVMLTGYEDSRQFFLGRGTLRRPEGLEKISRSLSDDGLLYTFDPAASLRLHIGLMPGRDLELVFVDGYGESMHRAVELLQKNLRRPVVGRQSLEASLNKRRILHGFGAPAENAPEYKAEPAPCFSFSSDGTELHMRADTPRPWTHVVVNELGYGVFVNNQGEIYSFMGNSQQNGLTPFSLNAEPVEVPGQVLYLYNMENGDIDGPTAAPFNKKDAACAITFGRGYAVYRKTTPQSDMELRLFVLPDAPAEVRLLTIRNKAATPVTYRVVPYLQMMLGETPQDTRGKINMQYDEAQQVLFFTNPGNEFHRGWAFVGMNLKVESHATSRARFIGGLDRDLARPFMVEHGMPDMSRSENGYTAAALTGMLTIAGGGEQTVVVVVGQTETLEQAGDILRTCRDPAAARAAFEKTKQWWAAMLSVLRVQTNKSGFDRLVNDWLPYQVFTSHLWGRLGPSQRSGGYGYRDQLQAALPLLFIDPATARSQILLHSAQQFFYGGDVLQWWHQSWEGKSGLGARNRASDPHLWLPYLVYHYIEATGDSSILDEEVPFLERRRIPRDREGVMFAPRQAPDSAKLYIHCIKAVNLTLARLGAHGLPLLGTGDWNDGLSLVGFRGRGESVWLGFFLYDIIMHFAPFVGSREGEARKKYYLDRAAQLRQALDAMWRDGRYVRAITDTGEEMIFADALNAAWPAISGAADFDHSAAAVEHGLRDLEKENMVLLLSPPFTEHSRPYPGKIADYPPGVRENGGQYSHGTSWLVDALARLAVRASGGEQAPRRAAHYRARAVAVWSKISPLAHTTTETIRRYGLPPHQQPADIYYGYGYEGRGGWSWYTGAAARMLFAAYQILGLTMKNGELIIPDDLFEAKGSLQVHRLIYKGKNYAADP